MAQAFTRVRVDEMIEDFDDNHFYHERSGNHYEMVVRGEEVYQRRYRLDSKAKEYAILERRVDWIVGSGKHGRGYMYQTDRGELFQMPLMWYSQSQRWGMAPGYDTPDHSGFTRQVNRRCMSCHNAYPDVPKGSDLFGQPQLFPKNLPEGIGCQRCHGPGAEHVRLAEANEVSDLELKAAIVNPKHLEIGAQEDLCFQCHLQATSAIPDIVQRFGVGSYAFEPGMRLTETQVAVNINDEPDEEDRFEINHHGYRLKQSLCYMESEGELTCLTCHDPHRTVTPIDRAAYYRDKCVQCHEPDVCADEPRHAMHAEVAMDDCVTCHMPTHRPSDVVKVTMTDHRIRRKPAPKAWLAPRDEEVAEFGGSEVYGEGANDADPDAALYRAMAATNCASPPAILELQSALEEADDGSFDAWFTLGNLMFMMDRPEDAEAAFRRAVELEPDSERALYRLGSTLAFLNALDEGLVVLESSLELEPDDPEALLITGILLAALDRVDEAIVLTKHSTELRPNDFESQLTLGNLYLRQGLLDEATAHYRIARRTDPRNAEAHDNLGAIYRRRGKFKSALRAWENGIDCVPDDLSLNQNLAAFLLTCKKRELRSPLRSLGYARTSVKLAPGNARSALIHALALLENNEFALAQKEARRAGSLDADGPSWRIINLKALKRLGKPIPTSANFALAQSKQKLDRNDLLALYISRNHGQFDD